ncbi:MAG TPA: hypothetical protein VGN51_13900 [Acidimicrobiia bacterium]
MARLQPDDVRAACADLTQGELNELAQVADVPRVVLVRDASGARILRSRARRSVRTLKIIVELLVRPTRDLVIAALGDGRSEDPSYDDLVSVLPDAVDRDGARRVALLLAYAVDDTWAAAELCRRLLETDDRFVPDALGEPVDDDIEASPPRPSPPKVAEVGEQARPKRTKADRRKRTPAQAPPPRYKKKRPSRPSSDEDASPEATTADPPPVTMNGGAIRADAHERRAIRLVGSYRDVDRDDPMVGRVVLAEVVFDGPISGGKVRPCVVVAASGRHDLVVRPCYSEGGRRAEDFRAVPVSDVRQAGLDRSSYVSHDEQRIPRSAVADELGWLSVADWNQL